MAFFPYGRRVLRRVAYPASAGTWRASAGFTKMTMPATISQVAYQRPVQVPINTQGQVSGLVQSGGTVTLQAGPSGVGASWALDQVGIGTSLGAADTSTCNVYVGPQATAPYLAGTSYAGGGDAVGLAGYTIQPGEFVWCVWSGATAGNTAQMKVAGTQTVLST